MPTFKGKERHERGEMPGAFGEKDARNPEKAPLFLERQGVFGEKHPRLITGTGPPELRERAVFGKNLYAGPKKRRNEGDKLSE